MSFGAQHRSESPGLADVSRRGALPLAGARLLAMSVAGPARAVKTSKLRFRLWPKTGRYELVDKQTGVTWQFNPYQPRFGEVTLSVAGKVRRADVTRGPVERVGGGRVQIRNTVGTVTREAVF